MSAEVEIRIYFKNEISPSLLVERFLNTGWDVDLDGSLSLLAPKDFDSGDWETIQNQDISHLLKWSKTIDRKRGGFGFLIVHRASGIGGTMIMDVDRKILAWGVSVNIPHLLNERMLVDFSQCLSVIWPAVNCGEIIVNRFEMFLE